MARSWPFVEFRHAGIYLSLVAWYRLVGVTGRAIAVLVGSWASILDRAGH